MVSIYPVGQLFQMIYNNKFYVKQKKSSEWLGKQERRGGVEEMTVQNQIFKVKKM